MFDSNAMQELSHLKAQRYARNGGGGGFKVATSTKAYYAARGYDDMTPFEQATYRAREAFKWACDHARSELAYAPTALALAQCEQNDAARYALATIPF